MRARHLIAPPCPPRSRECARPTREIAQSDLRHRAACHTPPGRRRLSHALRAQASPGIPPGPSDRTRAAPDAPFYLRKPGRSRARWCRSWPRPALFQRPFPSGGGRGRSDARDYSGAAARRGRCRPCRGFRVPRQGPPGPPPPRIQSPPACPAAERRRE